MDLYTLCGIKFNLINTENQYLILRTEINDSYDYYKNYLRDGIAYNLDKNYREIFGISNENFILYKNLKTNYKGKKKNIKI